MKTINFIKLTGRIMLILFLFNFFQSMQLQALKKDRGMIFLIGPDVEESNKAMTNFEGRIKVEALKNHFSETDIKIIHTQDGYIPEIKEEKLGEYKKLIVYLSMHGFNRGKEPECYVIYGNSNRNDILDFRNDLKRPSAPVGTKPFKEFLSEIQPYISQSSQNTMYIFEICSLVLEDTNELEGTIEYMLENLKIKNYAADKGMIVSSCGKALVEQFQDILNVAGKKSVGSITLNDLKYIFPENCIKTKISDNNIVLNPRIFSFYKTIGEKKIYLQEIDLDNELNGINIKKDFYIGETQLEIVKQSNYKYKIRKENDENEEIDLNNRTIAELDIENFKGYNVNFESDYPDLVTPTAGAFKLKKGQEIRFSAINKDNILFSHWVVNEKKVESNPLIITVKENVNIKALFNSSGDIPILKSSFSKNIPVQLKFSSVSLMDINRFKECIDGKAFCVDGIDRRLKITNDSNAFIVEIKYYEEDTYTVTINEQNIWGETKNRKIFSWEEFNSAAEDITECLSKMITLSGYSRDPQFREPLGQCSLKFEGDMLFPFLTSDDFKILKTTCGGGMAPMALVNLSFVPKDRRIYFEIPMISTIGLQISLPHDKNQTRIIHLGSQTIRDYWDKQEYTISDENFQIPTINCDFRNFLTENRGTLIFYSDHNHRFAGMISKPGYVQLYQGQSYTFYHFPDDLRTNGIKSMTREIKNQEDIRKVHDSLIINP